MFPFFLKLSHPLILWSNAMLSSLIEHHFVSTITLAVSAYYPEYYVWSITHSDCDLNWTALIFVTDSILLFQNGRHWANHPSYSIGVKCTILIPKSVRSSTFVSRRHKNSLPVLFHFDYFSLPIPLWLLLSSKLAKHQIATCTPSNLGNTMTITSDGSSFLPPPLAYFQDCHFTHTIIVS